MALRIPKSYCRELAAMTDWQAAIFQAVVELLAVGLIVTLAYFAVRGSKP